MSSSEPFSFGDDDGGGNPNRPVEIVSTMRPTIKDAEGREVTPATTITLRATTQNDNLVHRSLCGQSTVEAIGEDEWNVTMEGIVLLDQLETLMEMRPANNELTIIGDARTHRNVNFDRFTYEQNEEMNRGNFSYKGRDVTQPIFEFQLQTQDDDS